MISEGILPSGTARDLIYGAPVFLKKGIGRRRAKVDGR